MGQDELAELRLERESVHTCADGQDDHRRRAVDRIPGADLLRPGLQKVIHGGARTRIWRAQDREDAAKRGIDVNVRRAVERPRPGAIVELPVGHPPGDRLARERNIEDERVQLPARARMVSPLLDQ